MHRTGNARCTAALLLVLVLAPGLAAGNGHRAHERVLHVPATVHGFIGGESHDTYAISARPGLALDAALAWKREGDDRAEFTVSDTRDFASAQPPPSGTWSQDQRQWSGPMPANGRLYVHVVAHPSAHYTLTIRSAAAPKPH